MRKTIARPLRAAGATIASFGLIVGLGACSSDVDVEEFCEQAAEIGSGSDPQGPEDMGTLADKINGITAPDPVKDDWAVLQGSYNDIAEVMEGLDEDDVDANIAAQEELAEKIDTEKIMEAGQNVDSFLAENCES